MSDLPKYESPPVVEVVCGVEFEHLNRMKAPHLGLFWGLLKDEFPECEHAHPLGSIRIDQSGLPFPRVWFVSQVKTQIVQVQSDRFLYNWWRMPSDLTLNALLDFVMISKDLPAKPGASRDLLAAWQIWHPTQNSDIQSGTPLYKALLDASDHFHVSVDLTFP